MLKYYIVNAFLPQPKVAVIQMPSAPERKPSRVGLILILAIILYAVLGWAGLLLLANGLLIFLVLRTFGPRRNRTSSKTTGNVDGRTPSPEALARMLRKKLVKLSGRANPTARVSKDRELAELDEVLSHLYDPDFHDYVHILDTYPAISDIDKAVLVHDRLVACLNQAITAADQQNVEPGLKLLTEMAHTPYTKSI